MFKRFLAKHSFSEYSFRSDLFPDVRDRYFWESFQNGDCVRLAEEAMDYAWPVIKATDFMEFKRSGNRAVMEKIHFDRRNHLVLFALAELKENKGRFLPQIVNGLFTVCEESFWGLSAHMPDRKHALGNIPRIDIPYIDLFAAETAEQLAMISTLLREPLAGFCPEIADRVEEELERRIKAPYLSHRDFWWMGYHSRPNNWNPWILSNILTVFLLTETSERRLCRALEKMFLEIQFYYDALPADGGCDEGPDYWGRAGASLFEFVYQLKAATDGALDLFDDEKLCGIAGYLAKVHIAADYFTNVADAHAVGLSKMMPLLFGFAKETKQEALMNFGAAIWRERTTEPNILSHSYRTVRRLILHSRLLREMEDFPISYPLHGRLELLPEMEMAVLREGTWILSAKGGFNDESHNHNDVGSFTLYDGTTPVFLDVGINTYTRFTFQSATRYTMIPWTRSPYHNLPLVRGTEQRQGKEFRADGFRAEEGRAEISFAGAYPAEAGLGGLSRELTLGERGLTCTDRFTFADSKDRAVTEVLVSVLPVRVEGDSAVIGEKYRLRTSCGVLRAEWVPFEDARLEADWKAQGVTRILIDTENIECLTMTLERV